jgi:hypothetical protein
MDAQTITAFRDLFVLALIGLVALENSLIWRWVARLQARLDATPAEGEWWKAGAGDEEEE